MPNYSVYDIPVLRPIAWRGALLPARIAIRNQDPTLHADVVVCHLAYQFFCAHRAFIGKALEWVYVLHGSDLNSPHLDYCLSSADRILARSPALAEQLFATTGFRVDGIAYSGVDFPNLQPKPRSEKIRVVVACLLISQKGIDSVLRALADLVAVDYEFDIYGDGPQRSSLGKLSSDLGISDRVRFHGFVGRDVVLSAMRSSDLFVMPSAPETLGLAYLEAMAQGCVVVGRRGWGVDGIVRDGENGFLCDSVATDSVRFALERYLKADRERIHLESRKTAEKFKRDDAIRNYAKLIGAM
jgi:glycosyltransferase involved in cell wall biosynthesis